jgi:hypothetical protein
VLSSSLNEKEIVGWVAQKSEVQEATRITPDANSKVHASKIWVAKI